MGLNNYYSDYGSGSSSSSSSWRSQQEHRWSTFQSTPTVEHPQKSSSYSDLVMGRCTLEDVMREFQANGSDSPYNPDEDRVWGKHSELSGMGPSGAYCRQQSWPAPERSPALRLVRAPPAPAPAPAPKPAPAMQEPHHFATSTPIFDEPLAPFTPELAGVLCPPAPAPAAPLEAVTAEQARVLRSLPAAALHELLRALHAERRDRRYQECRFCKNNGEREAYYRAHALKDARGRVLCPVLRAFVCARCGARGDHAHTIKYCPLSTNEERIKSSAMMRSVRMASGRRRANSLAPAVAPSLPRAADCAALTAPSVSRAADCAALAAPSFATPNNYTNAPLDPLWAALEQKLML